MWVHCVPVNPDDLHALAPCILSGDSQPVLHHPQWHAQHSRASWRRLRLPPLPCPSCWQDSQPWHWSVPSEIQSAILAQHPPPLVARNGVCRLWVCKATGEVEYLVYCAIVLCVSCLGVYGNSGIVWKETYQSCAQMSFLCLGDLGNKGPE